MKHGKHQKKGKRVALDMPMERMMHEDKDMRAMMEKKKAKKKNKRRK